MSKRSGICSRCKKKTEKTKLVADDWNYRLIWIEACYDCIKSMNV